jgi:hypothetical protein
MTPTQGVLGLAHPAPTSSCPVTERVERPSAPGQKPSVSGTRMTLIRWPNS